jgi:hypothetical protein
MAEFDSVTISKGVNMKAVVKTKPGIGIEIMDMPM